MSLRQDGAGGPLRFDGQNTNAIKFGFDTATNTLVTSGGSVILGATSTSNNAQFRTTKTYGNASGVDAGFRWDYTQSAATTGSFLGNYGFLNVTHESGTVGQAVGTYLNVDASGAGGTTTDLWGSYISVRVSNASAIVTNAVSLFIDQKTRTGTITNDWAIYSGDTAASYLAGDLRIGTTSATSHGEEVLRIASSGSKIAASLAATDGNGIYLQFANTDTGTLSNNGFVLGVGSSEDVAFRNYESTSMQFFTANTERFRVASDAHAIGIGTTDVESWSSSYGVVEFTGSAIAGSTRDRKSVV